MIKKDHFSTAITSGLSIYGGCLLGALTKVPIILLLFAYILPGLVFGMVLAMTNDKANENGNTVMGIVSVVLYSFVVYLADIPDRSEIFNLPVRIILASITGASLLSISYDLLINEEVQLLRTFINPILIGIAASSVSAFSVYKMDAVKFNQDGLEFLNQLGLYSIYPIWQVLFIWNKGIK